MPAQLAYFPGSPFARMARVLVQEWSLPVEPVEWAFPADDALFALNPMGQVPALMEDGAAPLFPTFLILERLWEMAGCPPAAYAPPRDRQTLLTTLQAGDAIVTALYIDWTGLRPAARNHIGYDLAERSRARFVSVVDWLAAEGRVGPGLTLPGVALAALALWLEARGGLPAPLPRGLAQSVEALAERPSFRKTAPQPWSPGN